MFSQRACLHPLDVTSFALYVKYSNDSKCMLLTQKGFIQQLQRTEDGHAKCCLQWNIAVYAYKSSATCYCLVTMLLLAGDRRRNLP